MFFHEPSFFFVSFFHCFSVSLSLNYLKEETMPEVKKFVFYLMVFDHLFAR